MHILAHHSPAPQAEGKAKAAEAELARIKTHAAGFEAMEAERDALAEKLAAKSSAARGAAESERELRHQLEALEKQVAEATQREERLRAMGFGGHAPSTSHGTNAHGS